MRYLIFSGSIREDSYNAKLARIAAGMLAEMGKNHTLLNLAEYPLPLYDGDLEAQAMPEHYVSLRRCFAEHQGFVIANPEYNSSITPLLKNTLDWVSRKHASAEPYEPYAGKTALLLAASPGGLGGQRAVRHTREILTALNMVVMPQYVSIPFAGQAFNADGQLNDAKQTQAVQTQLQALTALTEKLFA